jgi:hypothetical protein
MDPANAQLWWGVAFSTSNQFGVAGFSRILARIFEVGGQKYDCVFQADQWRFGPGLGGNLGATFLVGLNVRKPDDLRTALGSSSFGWEFTPGFNTKGLGTFLSKHGIDRLVRSLDKNDFLARNAKETAKVERISNRFAHVLRLQELGISLATNQPGLIAIPLEIGAQASLYLAMASEVEVIYWG